MPKILLVTGDAGESYETYKGPLIFLSIDMLPYSVDIIS